MERVSPVKVKMGKRSHVKPIGMASGSNSERNYLKLENLIGKPESCNIAGPIAVKITQISDHMATKGNKSMR